MVLEISLVLSVLAMLGAVWAPSPPWMYAVFVAVGLLSAADILSMLGIVMEFTEPDNRPTYMGLANTIPGLFAAVAPMIGGWMVGFTSYATTFATGALLSLVALAVLHYVVREPRDNVQAN
jgi:MFS family permease